MGDIYLARARAVTSRGPTVTHIRNPQPLRQGLACTCIVYAPQTSDSHSRPKRHTGVTPCADRLLPLCSSSTLRKLSRWCVGELHRLDAACPKYIQHPSLFLAVLPSHDGDGRRTQHGSVPPAHKTATSHSSSRHTTSGPQTATLLHSMAAATSSKSCFALSHVPGWQASPAADKTPRPARNELRCGLCGHHFDSLVGNTIGIRSSRANTAMATTPIYLSAST